jgi:Ca-activated chloride channel homolog
VPVGLRVVLGWNANDVDIDLWVRDPAGEWAYYSQKQTSTGGQMSEDFTQGYGPETFTIARPLPGTYTVYAHYFANHEQKLAAPISVYLEFQTPFGRGAAKTVATVRRLDTSKEEIEIGSFTVQ